MNRKLHQLTILHQLTMVIGFIAVVTMISTNPVCAQKDGKKGGGGGITPKYNVIDLGPMWRAYTVTEKDATGAVWIAGAGADGSYVAAMAAKADAAGVLQVTYLPEPDKDVILPNGHAFDGGSEAVDVNEAGDMVGGADVYDPGAYEPEYRTFNAAYWENVGEGSFKYHPLLPLSGDVAGAASGINSLGIVAGQSRSRAGVVRAVLWLDPIDNAALDLNGLLPVGSNWELGWASDINDFNQVCGYGLFQGVPRGFRFDLNNGEIVAVPILPGGTTNGAFKLNQAGHVIGPSETGQFDDRGQPIFHGSFWKGVGQNPIDLGSPTSLSSGAEAINNQDNIVGDCTVVYSFPSQWLALRWDNGAPPPVALETEIPGKPSWQLKFAFGINDAGWIVGAGTTTFRGRTKAPAFLLVPTEQ